MSTFRYRNGAFETPIVEFENPDTGSQVNVIGLTHNAPQRYFDTINDYVSQAGGVVHYESIRFADKKAARTLLSPEAIELFGAFIQPRRLSTLVESVPAVVDQDEGLHYQAEWKNHDMSAEEFIQRLGISGLKKLLGATPSSDQTPPLPQDESNRQLPRLMPLLYPLVPTLNTLLSLAGGRQAYDVVIRRRNAIAVSGVQEELVTDPSQKISVLWGCAHVPGIVRGIKKLGYRKKQKFWVGAFSVMSS